MAVEWVEGFQPIKEAGAQAAENSVRGFEQRLSCFDFFYIVTWKANRAKSKIATLLLAQGYDDLEAAVAALIQEIAAAAGGRERLRVLIKTWHFRLPMASAILTVLYPEEFTVYDARVCAELGDFADVQFLSAFDSLWDRYCKYILRVQEAAPPGLTLRQKDQYLYGRSFARQLQRDIETGFRQMGQR